LENFLEGHDDFATPIDTIYQFLNLSEEECQSWIDRMKGLLCFAAESEKLYTTERKWQDLTQRVVTVLQRFHASHALAPGMDMEELRGNLPHSISPRLFRDLIELLTAHKTIARDGNFVRLPDHTIQLRDQEKALSEKVVQLLEKNPSSPPDLKQIEKELSVPHMRLTEVIRVMERQRVLVRVATDLYFLGSQIDKIKEVLYRYCSTHGEISAATFRDLIGSSRKYAIGLLEYFDREAVTTRVGDIRRLRSPLPSGSIQTRAGG
jgi:selenocysteine-specific elongation factor